MKQKLVRLAAGAALGLAAASSHAELILVAPEDFSGSGLGAVNTILTIQSPASTSNENGMVSWNGSADVITGATALTGASQTLTRTLSELGITSAETLRIVFNASEPGNAAAQSIQLDDLTMTIYNPNGSTFFTAPLAAPSILFPNTFTGTGNSGFVFALDPAETTTLHGLLVGADFTTLRVGLFAAASLATGGNETFFAGNSSELTPTPQSFLPEPETYAMLLAGLGLMGFVARRRKQHLA